MTRVVLIVGMHRSGTSSLAGSLEEAGLHLGEVITVAPHNEKGNRENRSIMELQEAILVHSGGAWDAPPERLAWTDEHSARRDAIIRSYAVPRWGFKDPRTLVTLAFWREALDDVTFVGTFRHPLLVAKSLMQRNGGELARWMALWTDYNERMLALHEREPFLVVRFDEDDAAYRRSVEVVARHLDLPGAAPTFFEPLLRHHARLEETVLDERTGDVYSRLCAIAIR
ncbi:MAG TPA: sulfotransferase [Polyangiaceae bacterium]|jgi:hypothetical protein|nr:sulfotransferase [Polyangiaceae bacterium]